jgi:hypothetical protein
VIVQATSRPMPFRDPGFDLILEIGKWTVWNFKFSFMRLIACN